MQILERILEEKLFAIVRGVAPEKILPTAQAIADGGIHALEITFDHKTPNGIEKTLESISLLHKHCGLDILLGAGTVLSAQEVEQAADAGAEYMISPDTNHEVIRRTKELGKISIPGAYSPTEALEAHRAGADLVKLFPAGLMGPAYVKAVCGPLGFIRFTAVGNINETNIPEFLKAGVQGFGIGGNLVDLEAIAQNRFSALTETARKLVHAVKTGTQ